MNKKQLKTKLSLSRLITYNSPFFSRLISLLLIICFMLPFVPYMSIPVKAASPDFTITFHSNGKVYAVMDVDDGSLCTEQQPPNENDAVYWEPNALFFSGWFEDGAAEAFDFSQPINRNLDLYAQFGDQYMVKFKDIFGIVADTCAVNPGEAVPMTTANVSPYGHNFIWVIEGKTTEFDFNTPINGNITLTPILNGPWLVTFSSSGTQVETQIVSNLERANQPVSPTREGWSFESWRLGTVDGPVYSFDTPVTENITLYASWQPKKVNYTVALWLEKPNFAGTPTPGNISQYNYIRSVTLTGNAGEATDLSTLPAIITNLFTTDSSLKYAEFQSVESKIIQGNGSTTINLYAKRKVYTYTFDLGTTINRTMTIAGNTYRSGASATKYELKVKYEMDISSTFPTQGVNFVTFTVDRGSGFASWARPTSLQWSTTANIATRRNQVSQDMLSQDGQTLTYMLTASWTATGSAYTYRYLAEVLPGQSTTKNTIVYQDTTYLIMDEYNCTYQGSLTAKDINGLTIVNPSFMTYYYSQDETISTSSSTGATAIRCFLYKRTKNNFTFNGNKPATAAGNVQNLPPDVTLMYQQPLADYEPSSVPVLPGFEFCGWYRDSGCNEPIDFQNTLMPASQMIAYAKWQQAANTVTFYDGVTDGNQIDTLDNMNGEQVDFSRSPWQKGDIVDGKGTFDGWLWQVGTGVNGVPVYIEFDPDILIYSDIDLYAKWVPDGYTISYDAGIGGGTVPVDADRYYSGVLAPVALGASLVAPASNAVFVGWRIDGKGSIYYPGNTVMISGDVTFVACYSYFYNVTYDGNGNTGGAVQADAKNYFSSERVIVLGKGNLEKTGFLFIGWATSEDGELVFQAGEKFSITNNITLYAVWDDGEPPLTSPPTGDNVNMALWFLLSGTSLIALGSMILVKRKRHV